MSTNQAKHILRHRRYLHCTLIGAVLPPLAAPRGRREEPCAQHAAAAPRAARHGRGGGGPRLSLPRLGGRGAPLTPLSRRSRLPLAASAHGTVPSVSVAINDYHIGMVLHEKIIIILNNIFSLLYVIYMRPAAGGRKFILSEGAS